MKHKILEEIKKRKEIYQTSPADMIPVYNREIDKLIEGEIKIESTRHTIF